MNGKFTFGDLKAVALVWAVVWDATHTLHKV